MSESEFFFFRNILRVITAKDIYILNKQMRQTAKDAATEDPKSSVADNSTPKLSKTSLPVHVVVIIKTYTPFTPTKHV